MSSKSFIKSLPKHLSNLLHLNSQILSGKCKDTYEVLRSQNLMGQVNNIKRNIPLKIQEKTFILFKHCISSQCKYLTLLQFTTYSEHERRHYDNMNKHLLSK